MAWHHPIGGDTTSYNPYPLSTGLARRAQDGYADSDNGIRPRHRHSHQLQAGEIPSIESLVMSCNMAQAGQLWEKVSLLTWLDFFP